MPAAAATQTQSGERFTVSKRVVSDYLKLSVTDELRTWWRADRSAKMSRVASGDDNSLQGDFGETWLEAVAAGCGLLHGTPTSLDLEKADVELTFLGQFGGTYNPTVKVQVKTALHVRSSPDGGFVYDLDVKTYDVLRRTNHSVRRVLAVIEVAQANARVTLAEKGTLLVGRGLWVSLEGGPPSENKATQLVTLPPEHTIDGAGLDLMLKTYGTNRSTIVPEFDPWRAT